MVLDFKVNRRLVVGTTINFFLYRPKNQRNQRIIFRKLLKTKEPKIPKDYILKIIKEPKNQRYQRIVFRELLKTKEPKKPKFF